MVFHGEHGRNGKDTLIKLITHVLGGALSGDVPVEMLLQSNVTRNSSGPSPDVLQLRGMCLAWINEAEENQRISMRRIACGMRATRIAATAFPPRNSRSC